MLEVYFDVIQTLTLKPIAAFLVTVTISSFLNSVRIFIKSDD